MRVTQTKERILLNNAAWRAMHKTCSTQRNINYLLNVKKNPCSTISIEFYLLSATMTLSRRTISDSGTSHVFYTIKKKLMKKLITV